MPMQTSHILPYEIPPTSGLHLKAADVLAGLLPNGSMALEGKLARFLGVSSVQIECSGTAALLIALQTLKDLSRRRTVIIPAYSCPLVVRAIHAAGLKLMICDTQLERPDFDYTQLENLCDSDTLAIVPTHIGGIAADLTSCLSIAERAGAFIIEDTAQSLGAFYHNQPVGTVGDIGIFSLACGKGLTTYEGGFATAKDASLQTALQEKSRQMIHSNVFLETLRIGQLLGYGLLYNPLGLFLSYGLPLRFHLKHNDPARAVGDFCPEAIPLHRMGVFRKRVAASSFDRLNELLTSNQERAAKRIPLLGSIAGLRVVRDLSGNKGTYPFLMVVFEAAERCNIALSRLWKSGNGVTKLFVQSLPDYPFLGPVIGEMHCKNARAFATCCLTISNHPLLDENIFHNILEVLNETESGEA